MRIELRLNGSTAEADRKIEHLEDEDSSDIDESGGGPAATLPAAASATAGSTGRNLDSEVPAGARPGGENPSNDDGDE
ncbi:hypothetical protein H0H92_004263 [Tricholoma furcatifolium]|nr:hypothetical protein H0H92_006167 [Tricholoma furcatifolium]KAG6829526.1 hypothetical protein H0H92_004263 [Tricholoma furcatifolium]